MDKPTRRRVAVIVEMIGKGGSVLDIGCGDGFMADLILKNNKEYCGIEVSDRAIKKARDKGLEVLDADLSSEWSSAIKEKFDVVLAGEVIEHVFDTDRFLKNIYNALKEQGNLVLSTPNIASLGRRLFLLFGKNPLIEITARKADAGHIRYFTFAILKRLLTENGFEIIKFSSDSVNFDNKGKFANLFLASLFPVLGGSLIVKCRKIPLNKAC